MGVNIVIYEENDSYGGHKWLGYTIFCTLMTLRANILIGNKHGLYNMTDYE